MSSRTTAGIHGSLHPAGDTGAVRVEDRFTTDPADLWEALTAPDRLARWLGDIEGELRPGGEFRARFHASEWAGTGRVLECEPPRRLLVRTWDEGEEESAEHALEATLTADGDGTLLVVEERGIPVGHLPAYGAGLQVHVEDLAAHLAGGERCNAGARWAEVVPGWQALVTSA